MPQVIKDLNAAPVNGIFCSSSSQPENSPLLNGSVSWIVGYTASVNNTSDFLVQIVYAYDKQEIYHRIKANDIWNEWNQL